MRRIFPLFERVRIFWKYYRKFSGAHGALPRHPDVGLSRLIDASPSTSCLVRGVADVVCFHFLLFSAGAACFPFVPLNHLHYLLNFYFKFRN